MRSDNIFGSDYDFWHLHYYLFGYRPVSEKFIAAWRVDGQQTFGDQPFYLKPYVDLRGVKILSLLSNSMIGPNWLTKLEYSLGVIKPGGIKRSPT